MGGKGCREGDCEEDVEPECETDYLVNGHALVIAPVTNVSV